MTDVADIAGAHPHVDALPEVARALEMSDLLRRSGTGWLLFAQKMPDIFDAALAALARDAAEAKREAEATREVIAHSVPKGLYDAAEDERLVLRANFYCQQSRAESAEAERDRLARRVEELAEALRVGRAYAEASVLQTRANPLAEAWIVDERQKHLDMIDAVLAASTGPEGAAGCPECLGADGHSLECETGRAEIRARAYGSEGTESS